MSVASYVVNFDELAQYLTGGDGSGSGGSGLGAMAAVLQNILQELQNTPHYQPYDYRKVLETHAQNSVNGLKNLQVLNDHMGCLMENNNEDNLEMIRQLKIVSDQLQALKVSIEGQEDPGYIDYTDAWEQQIHNTAHGFQAVLEHMCAQLTTLTNVGRMLEAMREDANPSGIPKVKGVYRPVHAINPSYDDVEFTIYDAYNNNYGGHTFIPNKNILLTGVTYSQSAWKYQDSWDLEIGGIKIVDSVYTKEVAERKTFRKYFPVPKGTPIDIILKNNSGNSRQVWADVEYIELLGSLPNIDIKEDLNPNDSSYDSEACPPPEMPTV